MPTDLAFPVCVRGAEKKAKLLKNHLKTTGSMHAFLMARYLQIVYALVNCK
jgi:hypothetical protein